MSDLTVEAERSRAAKAALRSRLLTARRALSPSALSQASAALQGQLLAFVRREHLKSVAAYAPLGTEPGGADLPSILAAAGIQVLLPVLLPDNDLDWAVFDGALATGRRGLAEPAGPRLGVTGILAADLVLAPALAVDGTGRRIGRGGGSYDRALARVGESPRGSRPMVVALLHDGELIESVPAEPHDKPVDGALLPTEGFVGF